MILQALINANLCFVRLSLLGSVTLGENVWDLRKNHKFDAVHIDMNDIYHYDEDSDEEEKDKDKENVILQALINANLCFVRLSLLGSRTLH